MKDFLLIFRSPEQARPTASPEEMQANLKRWMDWFGSIAAQNKLADRGNRLAHEGKVVRPNQVITDGPYTEIKESIGGYIGVKAESLDEAAAMASTCPILLEGGNVEVREIAI
ncbi:YciI family protein [Spirosoma pollinicola]|uniref:Transcription initiation protein n=1 Tax=Spirosoma pollinicola TaxID=2057025 RepID=A0A2K8YT54_9BACT|nr:YciI family protein [Spirosoma pollinicola]AUD00813.1 transcription initiation protein [Spirosoma pollinicola]